MKIRFHPAALAAALIGAATCSFAAPPAPLDAVADPGQRIVDARGRALYTIELDDAMLAGFGDHADAARARFESRHSNRAVNAVLALERRHGFEHAHMSSRLVLSVSAYLTPAQVEALRREPHVRSVAEAARWSASSLPQPPWQDRTVSLGVGLNETYSWGRVAVGGIAAAPGLAPAIYIVDGGVGMHEDLLQAASLAAPGVSAVGCYPHGTHVAGIIAAKFQNRGVAGVVAGAPFVSVNAATLNNSRNGAVCADPGSLSGPSIVDALERIRADMDTRSPGRAAVVSISLNRNDGRYAPGGIVNTAMRNLATPNPAANYKGAFIAQSAGNNYQDACTFAYSDNFRANAADGIMVVGGVNASGVTVSPPPGGNGFVNMPIAGDEPGTNRGPCVDVYAPSLSIVSSWGPPPPIGYNPFDETTWQRQDVAYQSYAPLSGTSMAAPHVAGIAAAILQQQPALNPQQVESGIRAALRWFGEFDFTCSPACQVLVVGNPVASAVDDVVEHAYQSILARPSDSGGKAFWLDEVERARALGTDPREAYRVLSKTFLFGAEYANRGRNDTQFVTDLYAAYDNRAPDAGGQNYWLSQMAQGLNREAVAASFMFGAEFEAYMASQLGGASQRAEVSLVVDGYRGAFARLGDNGGFIAYRTALRSAECANPPGPSVNAQANGLVNAFFGSQEYASRARSNAQFVADAYDLFFRRGADTGGFNYWVGQVPSIGRQGVINAFFGSQEWANRVAQIAAQGCAP